MNLYLMGWALSFKCIQNNQHVKGLLTLPLKSQALCDNVALGNHTISSVVIEPCKNSLYVPIKKSSESYFLKTFDFHYLNG